MKINDQAALPSDGCVPWGVAPKTECAGVLAGSWFANSARRGEDLIAAGLLMLAGHVDLDQLDY